MGTSAGYAIYQKAAKRKTLIIAVMGLVTVVLLLMNVAVGATSYSLTEVLQTIMHPDQVSSGMNTIIWNTRLPQAVTALIAGAALGIAGAEMQTILDNPLAEPYTLGVSMAAAFGASLVIAFGFGSSLLGSYATVVCAFVFAMVACAVIYLVSRSRKADRVTIILTGVAMLFLFQALVSLVQSMASRDAANAITFWTFGSLGRTDWYDLALMAAVFLAALILFTINMWRLTSLKLGDSKASSLGVDVPKLRRNVLIGVSFLTATVVSFTGTIGFIGLVGPHIARMLVGEDQRFLLPVSALSGALFLLAAALVCKMTDFTSTLPIGVVTSLVGVPFFMYMILRSRGVRA